MNCKGYVFQLLAWRHGVSHLYAYSMAQRRAVVSMWCALVKVALNRKTDVLIFTYCYQCLILIRIRTVIFSAARFARSRGEHVSHSITQC